LAFPGVAAAQQPVDPPPSTTTPKPKKIYSNDDVQPAGSAVGPAAKPANPSIPPGKDANAELARTMRAKLERFAAQLEDADKQIEELKRFQAGESNGDAGRQLHKGYNMTPIPEQIARLEQRKSQLQALIDRVYDEARKKGILPGQLR